MSFRGMIAHSAARIQVFLKNLLEKIPPSSTIQKRGRFTSAKIIRRL